MFCTNPSDPSLTLTPFYPPPLLPSERAGGLILTLTASIMSRLIRSSRLGTSTSRISAEPSLSSDHPRTGEKSLNHVCVRVCVCVCVLIL